MVSECDCYEINNKSLVSDSVVKDLFYSRFEYAISRTLSQYTANELMTCLSFL